MRQFSRGRPPKSTADLRSHRVVTFLTKEEYVAICELAERNDRSLSAFVHRIVADYLSTRSADYPDKTSDGR